MIFSTVTRFVEQVGRRVIQEKRGSLDTMECKWVGPTITEFQNLPAWGVAHPEYAFMYCETAQVTRQAAGVSEITARYVGKLNPGLSYGGGANAPGSAPVAGNVVLIPTIDSAWHDQTISWITYGGTAQHNVITQGQIPTSGAPPVYQVSTAAYLMVSYSLRYTTKSVTWHYVTNTRPAVNNDAFDGVFAVQATNYLGFKNYDLQITGSSVTTDLSQAHEQSIAQVDILNDCQVQDLDNGWYKVSEVYMRRFVVNTSILGLARAAPPLP